MVQKHSRTLGAAFVLLFAAVFRHAPDGPVAKRSIIFLMDDQHRWDALAVVMSSGSFKNLDPINKNGVKA